MKFEIHRIDTERRFDELCNKVRFCTRCERMEGSARVLSRAAGATNAALMFIGEAPGRLGADESEIPFHGDRSGHNFEELLHFAGLNRAEVFVTNAVLCNPKTEEGNNATPTKAEQANCASYLRDQIDLVQPKIVVTLGASALEALKAISPHSLRLADDVRTMQRWYGRSLIPIYHPGARAMAHRSMANQRSDYQFVAEQLRRLTTKRRAPSKAAPRDVSSLAAEILKRRPVSYFALHKIFFLVEYEAISRLGHRLTGGFFLRQKNGPYCTDLHLARLRKALPALVVEGHVATPTLRFAQSLIADDQCFTKEELKVIGDVLDKTAQLTDAELKTRVYLSKPMRRLLRAERAQLINLYNAPIQFEPDEKQMPAEAPLRLVG